jgi:hypothetical protein
MSNTKTPLNVDALMSWPFATEQKSYTAEDASRYAAGFGAGLLGDMHEADQVFLQANGAFALPMIAVPLADGEFWHADPRTGIVWQKMVHAGESITVHKPLPKAGSLRLTQKVDKLLDRGEERGAVMLQKLSFADQQHEYVTIDVTMLLRGNGGFGGAPDNRPREKWIPEDRPADLQVEVATPTSDNPLFELKIDLEVAAGHGNQKPLRGVCSFGLAGRAALFLLCDNQADRLKHFSVKYAGMMFTDETMLVEVWQLEQGRAALRMTAIERQQLVLNQCLVEFS